ncbi:hypothetical protein [uncultured Bacteroides sp.]|uniref:A1S_2505 family phage non-structural protein n=1 Tax=uncultured Bacteroides sp. TaxID=162156 RepID=UPI002AA90767|nr:hypothetical protein [uncultured Bacteroides sp.]
MKQIPRDRITNPRITELMEDEIFVFGSNLQGMHYGGAARIACRWGAIIGQGIGIQGQTYAIPTMSGSVASIVPFVDEFIRFAASHPDMRFLVTEIGCGIAGYTPAEIAPLFHEAVTIENIALPERFWEVILYQS